MKKFFVLSMFVVAATLNARRVPRSMPACTFSSLVERVLVATRGENHEVKPIAMYFDYEKNRWHLFAYDERTGQEVDISISETSEFYSAGLSGHEEGGQDSEDS